MPGLSLVVHESSNLGGNYNHSRSIDQMCRQDSRVRLSAEEAVVAEESISVYCKPVELYNILQHRALRNPSFLQRCLDYRIQTKHKRRIQMTLSLPKTMNNGEQMPGMLPLYILLVRPISDITVEKHSTGYSLCRAHILTAFSEDGRKDQTEASFILPEMKFPTEGKASNLTILLISYGEARNCPGENDLPIHSASFPSKFEGHCLWGRLQMESLYSIWKKSASFSLGNRAETLCTVDMLSNFLKPDSLNEGNRIVFQSPHNLETMGSRHVQINVSAQDIGARGRSPHDSYTYDDVPTSLLSHMRLRTGAVVFSYSYFNNILHKTEVTEDFSCPFCLVRCGSFKGLRHHLSCSHDLFNFDFWVTEEYQAVNVSVKTDICSREIVGNRVDPKLQTVSFCSKPRRRRRSKNLLQDTNHVYPHILKLDSPEEIREGSQEASFEKDAGAQIVTSPKQAEPLNGISLKRSGEAIASSKGEKTLKTSSCEAHLQYEWNKSSNCVQQCTEPVSSSMDITGACGVSAQSFTSNDCVQLASGNSTLLQFAKSRKLSADPRNVLVQRRTFFHSHRAQPMVLDQVLSDRDSEDEVDDCIADFEDRRMLDDFVDVSKDEKQIMHLWNSFVRKQRVLADGHVPWACEAFSRLHGRDLVQVPELIWCWRLFMIKLWNHSLLDARAINNCNLILEGYQKEASDLKIS